MFFKYLLVAVIAYALGNFSTGRIIARRMAHIDIRQHGSGNAGATNILRTLGWLPSCLTLLGDAAKGALGGLFGLWIAGPEGALIGGICAIAGHNWPAAFGFKGGRGIAASFGAILVVDWPLALVLLAMQIIVTAATRYMSVASLVSAISYVVLTLSFRFGQWEKLYFSILLAAMAVYCHRENIARLRSGAENRLDFSKINKLSRRR